jgi:hypothetical protein
VRYTRLRDEIMHLKAKALASPVRLWDGLKSVIRFIRCGATIGV